MGVFVSVCLIARVCVCVHLYRVGVCVCRGWHVDMRIILYGGWYVCWDVVSFGRESELCGMMVRCSGMAWCGVMV